ncbi:MAG TPA: FMN-binding protein [Acidimicrobiales bacterium]
MTGSTYNYSYGQLAVRVTVTGAKITGLSVVGLQTAESYSQQIADQVIPMLRQEVLAAQSVRVNGISGASYTAEAYVSSVQSALNKLHFK